MVREGFAAVRRGDFAALRRGLLAVARARCGPWLRRVLGKRRTAVEVALLRLQPTRGARPLPPLGELRAAVLGHLPTAPGRVSAVVPCFNYGRLVVDAVQSLRGQNHPDLEIVVVDDGSTDPATLAALQELAADPAVRVVRQANQGLAAARMAGAAAATGEFLLFLDNDDRVTPECVALLAAHLHARPDRAFAYPAQHFFGDEELVWEPQDYDAWDLLWSNHPTVCSLIRRSAFVAGGGYDGGMKYGWEDWEMWIAMSGRGLFGASVPVPMFEHRRHGRTMTHTAMQRSEWLRARLLDKHAPAYAPDALAPRKAAWRPAVSVVVPFCNAHTWWAETAASLRGQTLTDFEVVVVDDASDAPESRQLLAELRRAGWARVVERPTRGGAAAARNTGVLAARSEFVFLLDADDLLAPTVLEELAWLLLTSPDCGFVYPGVVHFGEHTGVRLDAYDPGRLRHENFLTCAALLRREVYLGAGGMAETPAELHEDWDFWLRLAALGICGRLLPAPRFFYRRHGLGRSAAVRALASEREMREFLRRRNPVLFGDADVHPPHYASLQPARGALDQLTADLRERYRVDQPLFYDAYRRPNVPNPLPAMAWADQRAHVLLLAPHRRPGDGAHELAWLQGLDRSRCRITVVATAAGAEAWVEAIAASVDETFQLDLAVGRAAAIPAFLEYLLASRCIDVLVDAGTAAGRALAAVAAQRHVAATTDVPRAAGASTDFLVGLAARTDRAARLRSFQDRLLQGSLL